jgi:hypothetical protein
VAVRPFISRFEVAEMPTAFPKPPSGSIKALHKGLESHRSSLSFALADTMRSPDETIFALPHVVYFARLNHVKKGVGLQYARPVVWRYFVGSAKRKRFALAEVNIRNNRHTFASVHVAAQDHPHHELLRAITDEANAKGEFSFRVLRIPSIHVLAAWLRSNRRGDDLIVPLASARHFLTHRKFYLRSEFERLIRVEAAAHFKRVPRANSLRAGGG